MIITNETAPGKKNFLLSIAKNLKRQDKDRPDSLLAKRADRDGNLLSLSGYKQGIGLHKLTGLITFIFQLLRFPDEADNDRSGENNHHADDNVLQVFSYKGLRS